GVEAMLARQDAEHAGRGSVAQDGARDGPNPVAEIDSSRFVLMDEISGDGTPGFLDEIDEGVGLEVVDREEELARVFRLFVVDPARGAKEQPIADRARRALERTT